MNKAFKAVIKKDFYGYYLRPFENDDQVILEEKYLKLKEKDRVVALSFSSARILEYHRLFFGLFKELVPYTKFRDVNEMRFNFMIHMQKFDEYLVSQDGEWRKVMAPHSISFAKMNQEQFEEFFNECLKMFHKYYYDDLSARNREAVDLIFDKYSIQIKDD